MGHLTCWHWQQGSKTPENWLVSFGVITLMLFLQQLNELQFLCLLNFNALHSNGLGVHQQPASLRVSLCMIFLLQSVCSSWYISRSHVSQPHFSLHKSQLYIHPQLALPSATHGSSLPPDPSGAWPLFPPV